MSPLPPLPVAAPAWPRPAIVAVDMGYGHLRAAAALADACGAPVLEADRAPLAGRNEQRRWKRLRGLYLWLSRAAAAPLLGRLVHPALDALTAIPRLKPTGRDAAPNLSVRYLDWLAATGFQRDLVDHLATTGTPLLTTFYSPAVLADRAGLAGVTCVVTDSDVNRVWAAPDPARSRIRYCVPARRTERRLLSYGVPADRIRVTGFPLPPGLLGGPELRVRDRNLAARLLRLDRDGAFRREAGKEVERFLAEHAARVPPDEGAGAPPRVAFAVGGAGAQAHVARDLLASFAEPIRRGEARLALVAGVRREVASSFHEWIDAAGLSSHLGSGPACALEVVHAGTFPEYVARFESLLARTDVLWTKPSELTFFGALGLPLALAPALGAQEERNRGWALRRGAALLPGDPRHAAAWLFARLDDGSLARAAWAGRERMPCLGTYRILETVAGG